MLPQPRPTSRLRAAESQAKEQSAAMMSRLFRPALVVLGACLLMSGCNGARIVPCPGTAILADAAVRPVLKAGAVGADPSALLYRVEIIGISQSCSLNTRLGESNSDIRLSFRATRPPSGEAVRYAIPYFVAVNQGERIITKRAYNATLQFAAGAATVTFETSIDGTVLRFENGRLPTDYQYLVGLDVSEAERGYLKAMGRFAP
jgi:hypothetical protein